MHLRPCTASGYSLPSAALPTASVNTVPAQSDAGTVTLGVTSSAPATAWSWTVNGSTAGITGPTTATPPFTFTQPGIYVMECLVTINGVLVSAESSFFEVGTGLGRLVVSSFNLPYLAY